MMTYKECDNTWSLGIRQGAMGLLGAMGATRGVSGSGIPPHLARPGVSPGKRQQALCGSDNIESLNSMTVVSH